MAGVVSASAQLRDIAVALKEAGDRGNLNAMRRGIRADVGPLVAAVRDSARTQLPHSGGLNEYEASQRFRTAVLAGARSAGVRIVGKASIYTDTGKWRHHNPRGGKWSPQVDQAAAGWFSGTLHERSPEVTVLIEAELERVAARIRAI